MSTGTGIVIFGGLYIFNTIVSALVAVWLQKRRLVSEEEQARIGRDVNMGVSGKFGGGK